MNEEDRGLWMVFSGIVGIVAAALFIRFFVVGNGWGASFRWFGA